ncbi:MAG TPA: hypothetical protein VLQ78_08805, partial [Ornithinibacter sp.]|nr:hypothetical protein [Ornithinibacter sp.]
MPTSTTTRGALLRRGGTLLVSAALVAGPSANAFAETSTDPTPTTSGTATASASPAPTGPAEPTASPGRSAHPTPASST